MILLFRVNVLYILWLTLYLGKCYQLVCLEQAEFSIFWCVGDVLCVGFLETLIWSELEGCSDPLSQVKISAGI